MERMKCIMFGEKILDYWDDIMKDLGDIIAIPSVAQPQDGPYPFGKDAATAVDKAIEIAERYGIKTKNSDYYAMHAELGEGEENAVVMAHLDVVPAGEGWDSDPYTMVVRDGKAFGRGVSDNKGPAIVALHCLRAQQHMDDAALCYEEHAGHQHGERHKPEGKICDDGKHAREFGIDEPEHDHHDHRQPHVYKTPRDLFLFFHENAVSLQKNRIL